MKLQLKDMYFSGGEIWGVLGPNGAGKTTLLHTLGGLRPSDATLNNKLLKNLSAKGIAQSIGILFQDFSEAFPQTVWEYCKAGRFPHLSPFQSEHPDDHTIITNALSTMELQSLHHKNIRQLSGGEKQRLAIATILAQTPSIYLLDEPTNHLDVRHQIQTLKHFRALAAQENATIVMALHDVILAEHFCTHIILIFSDGSTKHGPTNAILTIENLSMLYQHPMGEITYHAYPCFN